MNKINRKGFTLIELLVVIAIIGILSAIGLVALNGAREKARDAARKSDIGQIRTGLALYYDDAQGTYPAATSALTPSYMGKVPTDPQGGAYIYGVCTSGGVANSGYMLYANLETSAQGVAATKDAFYIDQKGNSGTVDQGSVPACS